MKKRGIFFSIAAIAALAFLFFANQALFFVWQSAFTHANLPNIRKWFYINSALAGVSIIGAIFFIIKGCKVKKNKKISGTPT